MLSDIATLSEAAEYLRKSERFVSALARSHKIAHFKQGRDYFFNREALEAYRKENEIPAVGPNPFGLADRTARRLANTKTTG